MWKCAGVSILSISSHPIGAATGAPGLARAIGHDRGHPALVPQIVNENPALTLRLRQRCREVLRIALSDSLHETVREVVHFGPFSARDEGPDHVDALAAGDHPEGREADLLHDVAEARGRRADRFEVETFVVIEIER